MEVGTKIIYKNRVVGAELGSPCFYTIGVHGQRHKVSFSSLVIPIDQVIGLSDTELVNFVKCGVDFVGFFEAVCNAAHIAPRINHMTIDEIDKHIEYLAPWQEYDDENTQVIIAVVDELLRIRRLNLLEIEARASRQAESGRRRKQFDAKRDRLMIKIIERDGYHCINCGATKNLSVDHIVPISKGGSDDLDNLQMLCRSCNSSKGAR